MMYELNQPVLRTDASGMPLEWINFQHAVKLIVSDLVAYTCGEPIYLVHGGVNAASGQPSLIEVNSIMATIGHSNCRRREKHYTPPLNNGTLFRRDAHHCLYCGNIFRSDELSRDHVTPTSEGGQDSWNNVVTACKRCNHHKDNRTPEEAHMPLLAIPFTPTHAEYMYLQGRKILADQMEFLKSHFPRTSPLHRHL